LGVARLDEPFAWPEGLTRELEAARAVCAMTRLRRPVPRKVVHQATDAT
jgi:hypothetical protein